MKEFRSPDPRKPPGKKFPPWSAGEGGKVRLRPRAPGPNPQARAPAPAAGPGPGPRPRPRPGPRRSRAPGPGPGPRGLAGAGARPPLRRRAPAKNVDSPRAGGRVRSRGASGLWASGPRSADHLANRAVRVPKLPGGRSNV